MDLIGRKVQNGRADAGALPDARGAVPPAATVEPAQIAIPRHVAVIMDGNGRWAARRGLPRVAGHERGTDNIRRITVAAGEMGIRYLTLWAFSTENWRRPAEEVGGGPCVHDTLGRNAGLYSPFTAVGLPVQLAGRVRVGVDGELTAQLDGEG